MTDRPEAMVEMENEAVTGEVISLGGDKFIRKHKSTKTVAAGELVVKMKSRARLGTATRQHHPVFMWKLNGKVIKAAEAEKLFNENN